MDPRQEISRTVASRPSFGADLVASLVLAGSAIAAGAAASTSTAGAIAVAGLGGLAAGAVLGLPRPRSALARVALPVAVAIPFALLAIGLSQSPDSVAEGLVATGVLLAAWEPTVGLGHLLARRWAERAVRATANAPALSGELDRATGGGTIPVVIREYVDDAPGRRSLAEDTAVLRAIGYEPMTSEARPNTGTDVAIGVAGTVLGIGDPPRPTIEARFRLARVSPEAADVIAGEAHEGIRARAVRLGLAVGVVVVWAAGAIAGALLLGAVLASLPLDVGGRTIAGLGLLAGFATLVVAGPAITLRRLAGRRPKSGGDRRHGAAPPSRTSHRP
jgi:hypothetical protein